jgi:transcriptional regulator with XRE-family HTH domain
MRDWLIQARKAKGMTKRQTAAALNITESYYGFIEKGSRKKKMDVVMISKLAEIFGISVQKIIDLETSRKE